MLNFLINFIWRRKILFLSSALIFLVGIWIWAIFYTAHTYNEDDNKSRNISIKDFDAEHKAILAKFGLQITDTNGVRFVRPTIGKGQKDSTQRYREHLKKFESFLLNKDAEKMLQNIDDSPSSAAVAVDAVASVQRNNDIDKRKIKAEHLRMAVEQQSHYEHELQRMNIPIVTGIGPGGHIPPPNQRLVHFDLKGAPLKIAYIKRLLPIIKSLGATGLLLEYEDMFPYTGTIQKIAATNAYTKKEIKELLHAAAALGLSVMPLIQTFGHMEFILKLKEYQHLREAIESPQSVCPSNNDSLIFIEEMITQIIDLHSASTPTTSSSSSSSSALPRASLNIGEPQSLLMEQELSEELLLIPTFTHIHIGCDEVYRMGECSKCKKRLRDELFLSHVITVAKIIKKRWPHLKIVIWDDMLRHVQLFDLQDSEIGKYVEPMVWVYAEDIYRFVSQQVWDKYSSVFSTAWTASAFKGAHGETLLIPPIRRHLENNLKWLAVIKSESSRFSHGIQGIALTGWQRYDHFAVLCELLPTAIPSLAICLSTVSNGYFEIDGRENPTLSALTCPESTGSNNRHPWLELHHDQELHLFSKCMFPGSPLFRFILRITTIKMEIYQYLDNVRTKRGWMTNYNIQHNFSSPLRVEELIMDATRYLTALHNLSKNAADAMNEIYDKWTIMEFIEQHITPLIDELNNLEANAKLLLSVNTWPRRPLPYSGNNLTDNIVVAGQSSSSSSSSSSSDKKK